MANKPYNHEVVLKHILAMCLSTNEIILLSINQCTKVVYVILTLIVKQITDINAGFVQNQIRMYELTDDFVYDEPKSFNLIVFVINIDLSSTRLQHFEI